MRSTVASRAVFALSFVAHPAVCTIDYSQYVYPFMGGAGPFPGLAFGGGDIFVGGAVPFGMVRFGIDTYEDNVTFAQLNGGWTPEGHVTAFSMMHVSGTGGFPKYGIIPQMPLTTVAPPVNILDNTTYWQNRVGNDTARVGYYKTTLENGVIAQLSAARHSGIIEYDFPAGEKHVLVDLSHYLPYIGVGANSVQVFLGGQVDIQSGNSTYTGHGTYGAGWSEGAPFTVFFCGEFDSPPEQVETFWGRNTDPVQRYHTLANGPTQHPIFGGLNSQKSGPMNNRVGALFSWSDGSNQQTTIKSRIGISFISAEKACAYKNQEIPSWNLTETVQKNVDEWNSEVLSKINVDTGEGANMTNVKLLYSSLYFTHLMPSDRTGENPLWDSGEPFWDDFYTLWDIFRCTVSLYHLLQPARYETMIRSLIDIYEYEGYMPDGRSGNYNGLAQGGSNADNVLADAYVKGLRGAVNWTKGYEAMLKDAEVTPYNTFSYTGSSGSVSQGRGALDDWLALGYVAADRNDRCVSRTMEYALNDFAVAQVAAGESSSPEQDAAAKYLNRSANWQNSWNANVTHKSFSGFMAPRLADGSWNVSSSGGYHYNPALCGTCDFGSISFQATPFEMSFVAPHDVARVVQLMGGAAEFARRLDYIFAPGSGEQDLGVNGAAITTIMNIGNEPDFSLPYLYNYVNRQARSVLRSRALANQYFRLELYGLPGNSDAGALNSWLVWQMLGLYPVVTQPVYLLQSPWFPDLNVTVNGNRTLRIRSHGLAQDSYYVQAVDINGETWDRNWFNHEDLMVNGGTIDFYVGPNMTAWETGEVPPSPGHVNK